MNPRNTRALPQPQLTLEAFVDVIVRDSPGVDRVTQVILRGRVDADESWVLSFHKAGDPLHGDALAGNEPEVAQMLLTFWRAVAAIS